MSLKFGLNLQKKNLNGLKGPAPAKKKPIFDDEDEEETKAKTVDGTEEIGEFNLDGSSKLGQRSKPPKPSKSAKPTSQPEGPPSLKSKAKKDDPTTYGDLSSLQTSTKKAEEALELDPSIYDYDAAYDAIHAKTNAKEAAEKEDAAERKARYMSNLFEAAEVRKRDQLRARDKLLQREREAEGDEFADKEKFVTGAYKQQQEEVRKAEEEEKKKQEEEDRKKSKLGMQGFYRKMMEEDEARHQAAVEAAAQAKKPVKNPAEDETSKEKTEVDVARELNEKGGNVIINEEGQVADKRQLLSAGLNVVAKPKKPDAGPASSNRPTGQQFADRSRGAAGRATRERQTQMIADQIEQAAKRAADEEAEELRNREQAAKSRKTGGDISSAKERYLQRKREAAAAAGKDA